VVSYVLYAFGLIYTFLGAILYFNEAFKGSHLFLGTGMLLLLAPSIGKLIIKYTETPQQPTSPPAPKFKAKSTEAENFSVAKRRQNLRVIKGGKKQ